MKFGLNIMELNNLKITNMITATIILGEDAVRRYEETGKLPSQKWLMDNGGVVDKIEFQTKAEYDAYVQALSDSDSWSDYEVIPEPEVPRLVCPICGGSNVACDARVNPNTGEILSFFDEMDGACEKCGAVDLISPEGNITITGESENKTESGAVNSIWMRLGVTVTGTKEDIEKVLQGDAITLARLLGQKKFTIDGETYIPSSSIEGYNSQNETFFEEEDIEFFSLNV